MPINPLPINAPLALLCALHGAPLAAGDFVSQGMMPDDVLIANLERLSNYVLTGSPDPDTPTLRITRLLGKEDLGNSKAKIWFCVERLDEPSARTSCGDDVSLIRLDTGLWVLKDDKQGKWIVARSRRNAH